MNESYKELLVKKERGLMQNVLRIVCVVPTVFLFLASFLGLGIIGLIITIILGVIDYFVFLFTDIEYEYLYLDKEISVDKIMAKTRRKKVATLDIGKIEIAAPANSHQLDSYKNRQIKKTVDYSAGHDIPDQKLYIVYYEGNQKYMFNFDDDFVKAIRGIIPRKIFTD